MFAKELLSAQAAGSTRLPIHFDRLLGSCARHVRCRSGSTYDLASLPGRNNRFDRQVSSCPSPAPGACACCLPVVGLAAPWRLAGLARLRSRNIDVHVLDLEILQPILDAPAGPRPFRFAHVRLVVPKLYAISIALGDGILPGTRTLGR